MEGTELRNILIEAVRIAGRIHLEYRKRGDFKTKGKFEGREESIYDALTAADPASEEAVKEFLKKKLPEFNLIGEELIGTYNGNRKFYLIDALDCTLGYEKGLGNFGSIISVYENDVNIAGIVYNVVNDVIYVATSAGFERIGSGFEGIPKGAVFIEGYMEHYPQFTEEMEELVRKEFPGHAIIKNSPGVIHRAMVHNGECTAFFHTGLAPHDLGTEPIFGRLTDTLVTDHNGILYEHFDPEKVISDLESKDHKIIYANTILVAKKEAHDKMLGILQRFKPQLDKVLEYRE